MVEIFALYVICKNIGVITRARGVMPQRYQVRAIAYWFLFEFTGAFIAVMMGFDGIFGYLAALAGALLSIHFSYSAARAATPRRPTRVAPVFSDPLPPPPK